jgi:3-hydroxybutyryl-CoA dehydratase
MMGPSEGFRRQVVTDFVPGVVLEEEFEVHMDDVARFVSASGDNHPLHVDSHFARERGYSDVLIHGMLVASRSSAFIARRLVGTHGLLISMTSDFRQPIYCDQLLIWRGEVVSVVTEAGTVELSWRVSNARGAVLQVGKACAWLPQAP